MVVVVVVLLLLVVVLWVVVVGGCDSAGIPLREGRHLSLPATAEVCHGNLIRYFAPKLHEGSSKEGLRRSLWFAFWVMVSFL